MCSISGFYVEPFVNGLTKRMEFLAVDFIKFDLLEDTVKLAIDTSKLSSRNVSEFGLTFIETAKSPRNFKATVTNESLCPVKLHWCIEPNQVGIYGDVPIKVKPQSKAELKKVTIETKEFKLLFKANEFENTNEVVNLEFH